MTELTDILSKPPVHRVCAFGKWFNALPEDEQSSVKKAMFNPEWSNTALAKVLREHGMPTDRLGLGTHRRGECKRCGPI